MGDPKVIRRKYERPLQPWQQDRIEKERVIREEYGLKNKKEIWKLDSKLRKFKTQAKNLISRTGEQAKKEEKQLLEKLFRLGLAEKEAKVDDVLDLNINDLMSRRLQSIVYKRKLASSVKQARQFIVHCHIFVKGKCVDVPSYLVKRDEENEIGFRTGSRLADIEHAERASTREKIAKETKEKIVDKKVLVSA